MIPGMNSIIETSNAGPPFPRNEPVRGCAPNSPPSVKPIDGLSILTTIPHPCRLDVARNRRSHQLDTDIEVAIYGEFDNEMELAAYKRMIYTKKRSDGCGHSGIAPSDMIIAIGKTSRMVTAVGAERKNSGSSVPLRNDRKRAEPEALYGQLFADLLFQVRCVHCGNFDPNRIETASRCRCSGRCAACQAGPRSRFCMDTDWRKGKDLDRVYTLISVACPGQPIALY